MATQRIEASSRGTPQKRVHVFVSGSVQGVAYRYYAQDAARGRGLSGWVRNLTDGRVEAVFQGRAPAVDAMVNWCRRGPPSASVTAVEVTEEPLAAEPPGFTIKH
jgi:acylphosphatase